MISTRSKARARDLADRIRRRYREDISKRKLISEQIARSEKKVWEVLR